MKYKVVVLSRARVDVNHCFDFIKQHSVEGAERWLAAFEACKDRLSNSPLSRVIAPESNYLDFTIREVAFKTRRGKLYRVLFTVEGDEVRILRVRGPGQDYVPRDEL